MSNPTLKIDFFLHFKLIHFIVQLGHNVIGLFILKAQLMSLLHITGIRSYFSHFILACLQYYLVKHLQTKPITIEPDLVNPEFPLSEPDNIKQDLPS